MFGFGYRFQSVLEHSFLDAAGLSIELTVESNGEKKHSGFIQALESPQTLHSGHCAFLTLISNSLSHGRQAAGGRGLHCLTLLGGRQSAREGRRRGGPLPHSSHLAFTYFSKSLLIPNSKQRRQPLNIGKGFVPRSFIHSFHISTTQGARVRGGWRSTKNLEENNKIFKTRYAVRNFGDLIIFYFVHRESLA